MAIFRVRRLHCVDCDEVIRARSEIVDGVEQQAHCPECNTPLISIGFVDLNWAHELPPVDYDGSDRAVQG
jgi:hypothetical protein